MEETKDGEPRSTIKIAADGDVILVVGPKAVELRVHSLFLKVASKPFSAMLGPDWKEGDEMIGRDGPVELPLPEDKAATMELICAIIHHRNERIPSTLPALNVLEIAVTADKYDCIDALKFASQSWFCPDGHDTDDLMFLTASAYLFRNAQAFKEITKAMILSHSGPYLALSCEEVESVMSWKVFCHLEEARNSARLELADILLKGVNDPTVHCVHKCGWSSKYAYAYLKSLEGQQLWPTHLYRTSISKALESAEKMSDPVPKESSVSCTYGYKHRTPEYRRNRCWSLEQLNNSIGLCLHCVRSGSASASSCRVTH
ncbi:hypothetical protein K458DRAFT_324012 [Lentithecium fluviatile CBS 122367]|uniref:BTB domain-containing protein n=1 Tax=Lentithecium fluviatile CBS 122367 TaxID=1168545 RepID=A0A6G1IBU0_9PLEO|nr:hypothetical protein K458DRAFT_324012 [Lentithecium fluviatile CBS 122367]